MAIEAKGLDAQAHAVERPRGRAAKVDAEWDYCAARRWRCKAQSKHTAIKCPISAVQVLNFCL